MTKYRSHMAAATVRRNVNANGFVECHQSDSVLLAISEICDRSRDKLRILKLCQIAARIAHRSTAIQQDMTLRICVAAIFLNEISIRSPVQPPVKMAQIV